MCRSKCLCSHTVHHSSVTVSSIRLSTLMVSSVWCLVRPIQTYSLCGLVRGTVALHSLLTKAYTIESDYYHLCWDYSAHCLSSVTKGLLNVWLDSTDSLKHWTTPTCVTDWERIGSFTERTNKSLLSRCWCFISTSQGEQSMINYLLIDLFSLRMWLVFL